MHNSINMVHAGARTHIVPRPNHPLVGSGGFALITVLILLSILTVMALAFMESMRIDRMASSAYLKKYQAVLLSDAAVELAKQRLLVLTNMPASATYAIDTNIVTEGAPYLFLAREAYVPHSSTENIREIRRVPLFTTYYHDVDDAIEYFTETLADTNYSSIFSARKFEDITGPNIAAGSGVSSLVSLSTRLKSGKIATVAMDKLDPRDLYVNINQINSTTDANGLIGILDESGSPAEIPVNWLYITNSDGTIIGRYAYWMDDESSKVNLTTAGTNPVLFGTNLDEISVSALGLSESDYTNYLTPYKNHPFWTNVSHSYSMMDTNFSGWSSIKSHTTAFSRNDPRMPFSGYTNTSGNPIYYLKPDINSFVTNTTDSAEIKAQVNKISNHILTNLPNFGERYYKKFAGLDYSATSDEKNQYVIKIAANIRDYIDTNRVTTVVMEDGSISGNNWTNDFTGSSPTVPFELGGADELPLAHGKENVPMLSEYLRVIRVQSETTPGGTVREIVVRVGHYIELWNLSDKTITYNDLQPKPYIFLANRLNWIQKAADSPSGVQINPLNGNSIYPADIRINLPINFSIPAGGYAVITTDGPPYQNSQTGFYDNGANRFTITKGSGAFGSEAGKWYARDAGGQTLPTGATYEEYTIRTRYHSSNRYLMQMGSSTANYESCRGRLLFGNEEGLFDYSPRIFTAANIYIARNARNPNLQTTFVSDNNTHNNNSWPEASGNARIVRGDPRSNTEVSHMAGNTSIVWKSGNSAHYGDSANNQRTLGGQNFNLKLDATDFKTTWVEHPASSSTNYVFGQRNLYTADAPMRSLGELGYIYDPARVDKYHRGGARTLRFGQSDIHTNNLRNSSTSDANVSLWLGGLGTNSFAVSTNSISPYYKNAFMLGEIFKSSNPASDATKGRINPNSVARGIFNSTNVFHSVLKDYLFSTSSYYEAGTSIPETANHGLQTNQNTYNLAIDLYNEIKKGETFLYPSELSKLNSFHSASASVSDRTVGANISMFSVSDTGREEFLRRTHNLFSSQSLTFSIHSVSQSGIMGGSLNSKPRFVPHATVTRTTVIDLEPTDMSTNSDGLSEITAWKINELYDIKN